MRYVANISTLTTGIDTVNVASSVMVIGAVDTTANTNTTTLQSFDTITGNGANDTLRVSYIDAGGVADATQGATISGIENFQIRNTTAGQTVTLNASLDSGLVNAEAYLSVGGVTVTNLAANARGTVTGNGTLTNGASSFTYVGTATSGTVDVVGGVTAGALTVGGAGLTSATINSRGATANTVGTINLAAGGTTRTVTVNADSNLTTGAITAAAATSYVINGVGTVDISAGALAATVTSVNAAGNSGGVTVALGSNVTQAVVGSSGNDVITTGALVLTTGSVNGGGGTADVLDIGANVGNLATSALGAKYTNFEVLRVNGTLDMSVTSGINTVQLSGATNSITNLSATQAANIVARADIGATTLTLASATGTTDVLGITFGTGTTTLAATNAGVITATGFETLNLTANPGPTSTTGANRVTTITGAIVDTSLSAVNLSGTSFSFTDASSTRAVTWNATALTGNGAATSIGLDLNTGAGMAIGSVVQGSALRDTITIAAAVGSTFYGNLGNDIFTTTSTILTPTGANTDVTLDGGVGGTDQLAITGAATLTDTSFSKTTGFESLALAGGAVSNSVTGLSANAANAFASGITVTDSANQAAAQTYTWASGLYNQNVSITHTSLGTLAAADSNQSITTGGGADTVNLTMTAVVGAAGAAGNIAISTGAGNDTITVDIGNNQLLAVTGTQLVTINGGTGQDNITVNNNHVNALAVNLGNVSFVLDAGSSSTTAYDTITGFLKANGVNISDKLDFTAATLTAYAATAVTGYTAAELTVAVSAAGATTFAGTAAAGLTVAQKIAALQSVVTTNNGDSAFFIDGSNTYVFNNETAGDVVVQLVGQTGATALVTTNAVTANAIFIG